MPEPGPRELAVVYGGPSAEHEVSCISARRIVQTALDGGWSVTPIGLTHDKIWVDAHAVVFPVLHGPFGEDGVIQGHLEALGVPYVGAGVLSSAICMDKGIAKSVLHDHGIPVAAWRLVHRSSWSPDVMEEAIGALGLPLFVKPANLGSSIGVAKATEAAAVGDSVSS